MSSDPESTTTAVKNVSIIIDDDKNTKLHYLAATGNEEELRKHLETGEEKVDIGNYLGWTPLMMASKNGHFKSVQILLEHRADASKNNRYGFSALFMAICSGSLEIVNLILQHLLCGGVSRQSMQKLLSPLSLVAVFYHQDIMKYLIDQKFDINARSFKTGITPLMFASAMDNTEAFTLLLNKGADKTVMNCFGFTAQSIIDSRNKKAEGKHKESNILQNPPKIIVNASHIQPPPSHQVPPYFVLSPQPTFFHLPTNQLLSQVRKSSNTMSPGYYYAAPNVTPITPINYVPPSQVFFPPEFSPNQFYSVSPLPNYYNYSNELLNTRLNSGNSYLSPNNQSCV